MTCDDDATAACPAELKEIAAATTAETAFPAKDDDDDDDDCSSSVVGLSKSSSFEKNPALTQLFLLFFVGLFRRLPATNFVDTPPLLENNNAFGAAIVGICMCKRTTPLSLSAKCTTNEGFGENLHVKER